MPTENTQTPCQVLHVRGASTLIPKATARAYRFRGYLKKNGWAATFRKVCFLFLPQNGPCTGPPATALNSADEVLNLTPGEWVEVKSYPEILRTLGPDQRHRGMLFMTEMAEYCGRRLQVYKIVERILLEDTGEVRRLRNTVLLAGSTCSGLSVGCDRSCFHFWREAWLRRIG
jgi:hypothetical protein